jgi:hypothetical protein
MAAARWSTGKASSRPTGKYPAEGTRLKEFLAMLFESGALGPVAAVLVNDALDRLRKNKGKRGKGRGSTGDTKDDS